MIILLAYSLLICKMRILSTELGFKHADTGRHIIGNEFYLSKLPMKQNSPDLKADLFFIYVSIY
jgi:hypothetical protein